MPTLAGPAVDPTLRAPARVWTSAPTLSAPLPTPPPFTWSETPATDAPIVSVVLGRAITREVIGSIDSAVVDDWTEDVEFLVTKAATITASSWDPIWAATGDLVGVSEDGHLVYEWDPKGYIVWIELDGVAVWTGIFRSPVDIGDGKVSLNAVDPSAVLGERILGRAEQLDLLEDRGSFEDYASVADMEADGWVFPGGITASLVSDGVRGTKCLQVTGAGWFRSPRITRNGADGYGRVIEGAAFVKPNDSIGTDVPFVRTRAVLISSSAEDREYRDLKAGGRPDVESGWTMAPVTSAGRMQPVVAAHRCWVEGASFAGVTTRYDLITLREGVSTGAPPGSDQDLSWYFERVFRDLNSESLGGSDTGLRVRATDCGTTAEGLRWEHSQRTKVADVISMIVDRDGGPEAKVTPGWWIDVVPRLGSDRTDVAITASDLVDSGWTVDPGAQVEDFVVDTGRGSGTSWVSVSVAQPVVANRHRAIALVTGPPDRSLNELEAWAAANARAAARLHVTKSAAVSWELGMNLQVGDTVRVTDHDGLLGLDRRMRVVSKRMRPGPLLVELGLGETDA